MNCNKLLYKVLSEEDFINKMAKDELCLFFVKLVRIQ